MTELLQLVNHLNLLDKGYYLYGSSWGTCLAQEFAVTKPPCLLGMVLDGALCDGQVYVKTQWRDRISSLPSFTQKLLTELEDTKNYEHPAYDALNLALGKHFTKR